MTQSNIELVKRAFAAFGARDSDALAEVIHPDCEFFPMTRLLANEGRPYEGIPGIRRYIDHVASTWSELDVMPVHFQAGDDHVVVHGRVRGLTVNGVEVNSPADWIWKIREGKLAWGCVYAKRDAAVAMQAAGLVPAAS
jgi:ketosteroid isomerase-like protein